GRKKRQATGAQTNGSWVQTVRDSQYQVNSPVGCAASLTGLHRRELVWVHRPCPEDEKIFIRLLGEGVQRLSPGDDLATKALCFPARRRVSDKNLIGERGDEAVALLGGFVVGAPDGVGKGREEEQPSVGQGFEE